MRRLIRSVVPWVFILTWVTTMGFWAASYLRVGTGWHLTYGGGAACLFYLDPDTSLPFAIEAFEQAPDHSGWWVWERLCGGTMTADHRRLGFRLRTGHLDRDELRHASGGAFTYRMVEVPFWSLAGLTAVPAAVAFARGRQQRVRADAGVCFDCGHDLRGVVGRCPECGTLPTPAGVSR